MGGGEHPPRPAASIGSPKDRTHRPVLWLVLLGLSLAAPVTSPAQERVPGYQGMFSNRLNRIIDGNVSKVDENISSFETDHSPTHLDDSYKLIMQSTDEIGRSLETAAGKVVKIPSDRRDEKINAQIDKLEVINIRDIQLPVLCDRLFRIGRLYLGSERDKARNCFSFIVTRFTSYESESCRKAAGALLDRLLTDPSTLP